MDWKKLPIIDWEQSIRLAGNNKQLAKEIIELLIKNILNDITSIRSSYKKQQFTEFAKQIHKLHGALCYCGLPRLKNIITHLETDLKNNIMESLPSLLDQLDIEVHLLLKQYPSLPCVK